MRVRAIKDFKHNKKQFYEGRIFGLSNELALKLIKAKKVVEEENPSFMETFVINEAKKEQEDETINLVVKE